MLRLNPDLDPNVLAGELAGRRRLQIRDIFETESAERIYTMLAEQTPWWVVFNEGEKVHQLPPEYLARLSETQVNEIIEAINYRAQTEYQFLYEFYPIIPTYFAPAAPKLPILEVFEFLNRPEVLDFFRTLTGRPDIQWADAQATLYQSGHFLKSHSDLDDANTRVAAYVLNFTKLWERDWGGYLQFYNDRHDIEEALRPIFNALNIFLVPADHSVGTVSNFSYGNRYSVTGWFRSDPPPRPIGQSMGAA